MPTCDADGILRRATECGSRQIPKLSVAGLTVRSLAASQGRTADVLG